jgi:hypothetical protein
MLPCAVGADEIPQPTLVVKPNAFSTLVNPNCSHCKDEALRRPSELPPDDRVLCWTRGYSDGGAIPYRFFLNRYRVISDSYGVFVHDAEAGFARGFQPSYRFRFHGWRNGVMVMKHQDGTLYSCLSGLAFEGPKKGTRLAPIPSLVSDWGFWLEHYPHAVTYHLFDKYQPVNLPAEPNRNALASRRPADKRLAADTAVLGVWTGSAARAYPLSEIAKTGLITETLDGHPCVILWQPRTKTASAYRLEAIPPHKYPAPHPNEEGISPPESEFAGAKQAVTLNLEGKVPAAPYVDRETGSRWDVAGRAVEGKLKGYVLTWVDSVQVKWFAWAAEYPQTSVYPAEKPAATSSAKTDPKKVMKDIAGAAEFLRLLPKPFAILKNLDANKRTVTLLVEGEKTAKVWPVEPDAELKIAGWWGRLEQFQAGERVWVWFKLNRKKQPVSVVMMADQLSEQDIHGANWKMVAASGGLISVQNGKVTHQLTLPQDGRPWLGRQGDHVYYQSLEEGLIRSLLTEKQFEQARQEQKAWLRQRWTNEGLPATVTFLHVFSGELECTLDHEAMSWARALKPGAEVQLTSNPPIKAVVKMASPWRERTVVRLVVGESEASELAIGQRIGLKMTPPAEDMVASLYPPDLERQRSPTERVEWFLASIYCPCGVSNNVCTGHFYTLASCNPNACGMPNHMRSVLTEKIAKGQTDRQILDDLVKEYGTKLLRPHLAP